ncbi:hypothetical protein K458DRAFT_414582 [Lentithecium fluviatile CBS 122367]|uniref:Uncharacterized protein n=1 Tax=Lentithecium fluviatile CBS 122367 TaxID=1168545 RepID=A0A6G1JEA1_9PLEO|nr:hypothetical protein K458DRAFT_414582 [Lentithecium fluviatile CBS 122367]
MPSGCDNVNHFASEEVLDVDFPDSGLNCGSFRVRVRIWGHFRFGKEVAEGEKVVEWV